MTKLTFRNRFSERGAGFTIVELLVVIVVIAILASITTVAFGNVQSKAHATKAAAAMKSYSDLITMYKTVHGVYPSSNGQQACLGERSHYPARDGFAEGACWQYEQEVLPEWDVVVNDNLNTALKSIANPLPDASTKKARTIGDTSINAYRGIVYSATSSSAFLEYAIPGDHVCPLGETYDHEWNPEPITVCALSLH